MIQVLISLSESAYKEMCENGVEYVDYDIKQMMRDATPLPKGHGRLIDADALGDTCDWCHTDDDGSWCYKCKDIDNTPTIIEADKEGAEK